MANNTSAEMMTHTATEIVISPQFKRSTGSAAGPNERM
jgi:hypothetical protein